MTSRRQDNETEGVGAGVSISLAVAGVVAAGVGLATMHFAFAPLPKPGVPVVVSTSGAVPTEAAYRHAAVPARRRHEAAVRVRIHRARHIVVVQRHARHTALAEAAPKLVRVKASAPPPKPAVRELAKADIPEKMCRAPGPEVLSPKALQPAMILRYDAKFRAPTPDIEPPRPPVSPSPDAERRLKLSALLANILQN